MATNDGEIIIELQLQQDDFEKRLNAIEHKTQSFGSSIQRLGLEKLQKISPLQVSVLTLVSSNIRPHLRS